MAPKPAIKYAVIPCFLCGDPVYSTELRQAVQWTPKSRWNIVWVDEMEQRTVHPRCWNTIHEGDREEIRMSSGLKPTQFGERV